MNLTKAKKYLKSIGYEIETKLSFTYTNQDKIKIRSHYIREIDTGLGAFHYKARRDKNYESLKAFRDTFCSIKTKNFTHSF